MLYYVTEWTANRSRIVWSRPSFHSTCPIHCAFAEEYCFQHFSICNFLQPADLHHFPPDPHFHLLPIWHGQVSAPYNAMLRTGALSKNHYLVPRIDPLHCIVDFSLTLKLWYIPCMVFLLLMTWSQYPWAKPTNVKISNQTCCNMNKCYGHFNYLSKKGQQLEARTQAMGAK